MGEREYKKIFCFEIGQKILQKSVFEINCRMFKKVNIMVKTYKEGRSTLYDKIVILIILKTQIKIFFLTPCYLKFVLKIILGSKTTMNS